MYWKIALKDNELRSHFESEVDDETFMRYRNHTKEDISFVIVEFVESLNKLYGDCVLLSREEEEEV